MHFSRRLRGLLGATNTWGAVGALVAATMFMVRYRPWSLSPEYWPRGTTLLGAFLAGGALWGSACGLAFGLVVWASARHRRFEQLSSRRFVLWGAVAGAAFPFLIYTPVVLLHGAFGAIPLYGTLTIVSAVLGAGLGRVVFAVAKRAPISAGEPAALAGAPGFSETDVRHASRERVW
jgi:hypothetical protein